MKQTTYRMTLDNGLRVDLNASSAGEAIEGALLQYRGRTVLKCHAGMTDQEARDYNQMVSDLKQHARAGIVTFEIPPHTAIPEGPLPPEHCLRQGRKVDATVSMFDDAAIESESQQARNRTEKAGL